MNKQPHNAHIVPRARRQRGASLLEIIAYLGIAAIVVLGAVSMLGSAFGNAQANRTIEEVVSIRTGIKRLYMGQAASYGQVAITEQAIKSRVLPATLAVNNNDVKNAWNGAVTITGATSAFEIKYAAVPQDACISILSGASGWSKVKVNATNDIVSFPITPTTANASCAAGENEITWTAT
ncbi:type 4 pilus major pilin [Massilia oculi]|nr:type 4 pilus major pilin [Massilia oculi]